MARQYCCPFCGELFPPLETEAIRSIPEFGSISLYRFPVCYWCLDEYLWENDSRYIGQEMYSFSWCMRI